MAVRLAVCTRKLKSFIIPSCLSQYGRKAVHTSSSDGKVYELRVYQIYPKDFKTFMDLTVDWIDVRTKHSKLNGYWTSEIGGINDVVHLWEYESLNQRTTVRQALGKDNEWQQGYISKILPWMPRQENMLLQKITESNIIQPEQKGVYEIEQLSLYGSENKWMDKLQQYCTTNRGNASLIGGFTGLIGNKNTAYILWHHESPDDFLKTLLEAGKDFVKAKDSLYKDLQSGHSRLLIPAPWSPLK